MSFCPVGATKMAPTAFLLVITQLLFVSGVASRANRANLRAVLEEALSHGSTMSPPMSIEAGIAPMYQAAPKNAYGRLDANDAAWLVQRYFVQHNSWQLAGMGKERYGQPTNEGVDAWFLDELAKVDPTGRGFSSIELKKVTFAVESLIVRGVEAAGNLTQELQEYCSSKKEALAQLAQPHTGRVPLDAFSALEAASIIGESITSLQESGAIVEVGGTPHLLVANYMLLPSNCLTSGTYHSVCCTHEGEALVRNLELEVQGPAPSPEQLLRLIPSLVSKSLEGEHRFTRRLAGQLQGIAKDNDGTVPLHSQAFATWLHTAFPHEFPLPWPRIEAEQPLVAETKQESSASLNFKEMLFTIIAIAFAVFRYAVSQFRAKPAPLAVQETAPRAAGKENEAEATVRAETEETETK